MNQASISPEIIASYAADAAREVVGVRNLVDGPLPGRRGVRVTTADGRTRIEVHLGVEWSASIPDVGRSVQRSVRDYLARMASVDLEAVDVFVDEIGPRT
jgi:uncharacterized alkaline shock family protein YloU